ncbi:NADPH:quinone reductase [Bordetella muralis]|jgi:NADPH:quinone reductase|uniref:NADPH:quinone reductase n=1 Tax=Bordetella muralis TaxID=1649130 RepID=UPI0039EF2FFD
MKAAVYRKFGAAHEVFAIEQFAPVKPAAGELLIAVKASGVNPSDVKNRAGVVMNTMPYEFIVPHSDGAGIVSEVGEGVDKSWLGKRVWVWNAQFRRQLGTAAQFVTLPVGQVAELPSRSHFAMGASLGIPAMTAYRAVTCGTPIADANVLVNGASGNVGRLAVQMAKLLGAKRVIGLVGDPQRAQHVHEAGADHVIGYRDDDREKQIEALVGPRGIDRIIEVEWGSNFEFDLSVIRPEGEIYVYGSAGQMKPAISIQQLMLTGVTMHFRSVYLLPESVRQEAAQRINIWLGKGLLNVPVVDTFSLEEIAEAHRAVEQRRVHGHVVLQID